MLCWHWWELSTAAAFGWAGSMPPLANRSPSGQSSKLPHPAGSFRKRGHGWVPERGLNREAEAWAESRDRGRKKEEDKMFPAPREGHRLRAHLSSMLPCSSCAILCPCPCQQPQNPVLHGLCRGQTPWKEHSHDSQTRSLSQTSVLASQEVTLCALKTKWPAAS